MTVLLSGLWEIAGMALKLIWACWALVIAWVNVDLEGDKPSPWKMILPICKLAFAIWHCKLPLFHQCTDPTKYRTLLPHLQVNSDVICTTHTNVAIADVSDCISFFTFGRPIGGTSEQIGTISICDCEEGCRNRGAHSMIQQRNRQVAEEVDVRKCWCRFNPTDFEEEDDRYRSHVLNSNTVQMFDGKLFNLDTGSNRSQDSTN